MGTGRDNAVRTFKNVFGEMLPIEEMYKVKDKMLKEIVESGKSLYETWS